LINIYDNNINYYFIFIFSIAIRAAGRSNTTVWSCDPMHGNTYSTPNGVKTRNFDAILAELTNTFLVHQTNNSYLGGVHFELTGEDVTECVGGPQLLSNHDLNKNYTTYCDPRLNYLQSMEMSFLLADLLRKNKLRERKIFNETIVLEENTKQIEQNSLQNLKLNQ
jgi:3-deoxy-D-arabino-heptulosonate 7-phosphate (DAHP) synthase class II